MPRLRCPDCNAEARTVSITPFVTSLTLTHDPSCPKLTPLLDLITSKED